MASSPAFLAYALLLVILAALFGSSLLGIDRLAFRDCSHFYTPLYGYIAAGERDQWLPLYNPLDIAGMPLAGETTTALFYPVRRVVYYLAPSPESALAWYVVLHLLLAGATIHYAAGVAGAGARGSALAILAYPLSGPILFLYCNPPFLVGAAWIPLAIAGGFRLLSRLRARDLAVASLGLAMPILGGDPQASIHVTLIGLAAALAVSIPRASKAPAVFLRLAAALLLAMLLASPQLGASIDWARQSVRYAPSAQSPGSDIYSFSIAPWHWLELVAPALSGRLFPVYTRISHLIPGDGQTWAITLYGGLIPLALAILRYRCTRWRHLDLWDCLAPIGLAFALGSFGFGYLLKILLPFAAVRLDDAAGGPYWWLATYVPGYAGFRYPAKWLVFVPLGIAIAAARQGNRLSPHRGRGLAHNCFAVAVVALSLSALVVILLHVMGNHRPHILRRSDPFWGPLQWHQACSTVAISALAVTAIAAAAFWTCRTRRHPQRTTAYLLVLLAIDLTLVAWPTVATVNRASEAKSMAIIRTRIPDTALDTESILHAGSDLHVERQLAPWDAATTEPAAGYRAMRFAPGDRWPSDWRTSPSPGAERMLAVEASMRNSLYGRWHLSENRGVFNPLTSLPPHRSRSFWQAANDLARQQRTAAEQTRYWGRVMDWLAIDQAWSAITISSDRVDGHRPDSARSTSSMLTLRIDPNESPSHRVVWSDTWRAIPEQSWVSPKAFAERLVEIASSAPDAPPLVESKEPDRNHHRNGDTEMTLRPSPSQPAKIVSDQPSPGIWKITVDAPTRGLVCIKQFQDGNWRAVLRVVSPGSAARPEANAGMPSATADPTDVYRCDYLFSAVIVPAGVSEVVLMYQPAWLKPSLALAALAWLTTLVLMILPPPRRDQPSLARSPSPLVPRDPPRGRVNVDKVHAGERVRDKA